MDISILRLLLMVNGVKDPKATILMPYQVRYVILQKSFFSYVLL